MSELEPRDSRIVTNNPSHTPIEPERTGPRENEARPGKGEAPHSHTGNDKSSEREEERWQVGGENPGEDENSGTGFER